MNILHDYTKESFDLEKINELSQSNTQKLIEDSEDLYHKQIKEVVEEIVSNEQYRFILLAGPSSSGKTTTSNLICKYLEKQDYDTLVVSLDDFYLDLDKREKLPNGKYDFESIAALDLPYIAQFVDDLMIKKTAYMPEYDFLTSSRKEEYKKITITDKTIVIVEGIHALNPTMFTKHLDSMYKIYICVNTNFHIGEKIVIPAKELRLMRRLIRDYSSRGASFEKTFDMWQEVINGEDLYIKPYKNTANYLINSTHAYEPLMYAQKLLPHLIKEKNVQAKPLVEMLEKCEILSPKLLPNDSLLHEFLD